MRIGNIKTHIEIVWMKLYRISSNLDAKIAVFTKAYAHSGFGGDCGNFAIELNKYLGDIGEYMAGINTYLWELGEEYLGHVALKVEGRLFDANGEIDYETLKYYGKIEGGDGTDELFNMSEEDCDGAEVINLSEIKGEAAEEHIIDWTSGT